MKDFLYKNFPETAGVYLMKNAAGSIIYVGKAGNLKRRVSSYFLRPHDFRIEQLVKNIHAIDIQQTDSALEALILEAELIKKYLPMFNVRERDDKSFLYVEITKEKFPRVLLARGRDNPSADAYGPFTSASSLRHALKILRRIFPWSTHSESDTTRFSRECLEYQIGLCPGTCAGVVNRDAYLKNIANLKLFFAGKKKRIIAALEKEMIAASKRLEFEEAEKIKRQLFALQHIRDVALVSEDDQVTSDKRQVISLRIEGYDISNISGTSAVGSMVVFSSENGNFHPDKSEYRKFKIRGGNTPDDVGMITEVLERRFARNASVGSSSSPPALTADRKVKSWPLPDLILIDGGLGQVHAARKVLAKYNLTIPIVGLAKGPKRKNNFFIGRIPPGIKKETLIRVRNEAHRFAIAYHKKVRSKNFLD